MITLFLKGGPLDGRELHNIPVAANDEPSLVKFQELVDGVHLLSQGLYSFTIVPIPREVVEFVMIDGKNIAETHTETVFEPHAIHFPSDQDKTREIVPVVEKKKQKVVEPTKEERIAAVVKLYLGVQRINPKKARQLRPGLLETLVRLEAENPEALLPDGPD